MAAQRTLVVHAQAYGNAPEVHTLPLPDGADVQHSPEHSTVTVGVVGGLTHVAGFANVTRFQVLEASADE